MKGMVQMIGSLKRFFNTRIRKDSKRIARYRYYDEDGEALRLDYPLGEDAIVIDAGGYIGDFAANIFCRFGCRVDVFEPISAYSNKIKERFRYNDRIQVIDAGLGASVREEDIYVTGLGSSVFDASGSSGQGTEKIRLVSVVDYLQCKAYPEVDLMKINIEGGEYELLEALLDSSDLMKKIGYLQVQFHEFVPNAQSKRENIRQRLSETHELMWDFPFIWESWKLKS